MRLRNYLLLVIIWMAGAGNATRAASLGFGATTFSKDTLHVGDVLHIHSYVVNYDTAAYNNFITFGLKINGIQNVNQVLFPNPFYDLIENIGAGDSIVADINITITTAYFDIGPDILVVWPIAYDGSLPRFSIDSQIVVVDKGVGINDLPGDEELRAFYANHAIYLKAKDAGISLNRVRILDLSGREILNQPTDGTQPLPYSVEPDGLYFVEVTCNGGEKRIYKIIKQ